MSMSPNSLDALRELAPGYVFGTLDAEEQTAFEAALRNEAFAAALQAEIDHIRRASDLIVRDAAVTPPPSLRDRLQARIALEARESTVGEPVPVPEARVPDALDEIRARMNAQSAPAVTRTSPTSRAVRVTPPTGMPAGAFAADDLARRRGNRAGWYTAALLGAGLAATLLFALDLRTQLGTMNDQLREKTALLSRTEAKLGEKDRTLATLLAGRGNVVLVNLDATAPTGPGMQVFWNVREGKAVVNAFGLAQIAPNRAYMLWMIQDGKPVPLKLFTPDENGRALVADVTVPTNTTGITLLAVTEESAEGAEAPTMTPFLAGAVAGPK